MCGKVCSATPPPTIPCAWCDAMLNQFYVRFRPPDDPECNSPDLRYICARFHILTYARCDTAPLGFIFFRHPSSSSFLYNLCLCGENGVFRLVYNYFLCVSALFFCKSVKKTCCFEGVKIHLKKLSYFLRWLLNPLLHH